MKLSNIVRYLNHLDTLSVYKAAAAAQSEVTKITHTVQHGEIQIDGHVATLISIQQDLEESLKQYEHQLTTLRQGVQSLIEQHEHTYFADSTDNYQQGMRCDTPSHILARTFGIDPDSHMLLESRLKTHTSWQFPGMLIRPAHNPWIESLVALDPMYLVDTHADLFAPVTSLFTPEYQRRLRYYLIEEYTSDRIFCNLPQEQFGVVCAFNYFNFKPWEVIKQYLDEVFVLLRPGGSFLFSFNDCDNWRAVGLVEHHYCCYTPGRLLRKHVLDLGYAITNDHQTQTGPSWMEIRKPGVLDSIRGGQALASVLRLPQYIEEDKRHIDKAKRIEKEQQKEQYRLEWKRRREEQVIKQTEQQRLAEQERANRMQDCVNELNLDNLIHLAEILNVDISQDKTKREFNIKKVRRTISAHLESMNYSEEHLRQLFNTQVIDKSSQDLYNALDLDQLIKLAAILKIDISEDTTRYLFDFGKVRRTISIHLESMNYSEEHLRRLFNLKENP